MRVSDLPSLVTVLGLTLLLAGATRPAPEVEGSDAEALRELRQSLRGQPVAEPDVWVARAWRALEDGGWPFARLRADTLSNTRHWRLEVDSGPRSRLGKLEVRGRDVESGQRWRKACGLQEGDPLSPPRWRAALARGLEVLSEAGFPFASVTLLQQKDEDRDGITDLVVLVRPGPRARIRSILVEGQSRTRPDVLARLSGLRTGHWVTGRDLEDARRRLLYRVGLVREVDPVEVLRVSGVDDEVDLRLRVKQDPSTGSFSGAIGARRGDDGKTVLSGSVELALRDLFGTARSFRGSWRDDGRTRSHLDLGWVEPALLGSVFDLKLAVGQRHEDRGFDMVRGDLGLALPAGAATEVGLTVGADRTTFLGDEGRSRRRSRAGLEFLQRWPRGVGSGMFGRLATTVQAAFVSERRQDPEAGTRELRSSVRHTLIEARGRAGWAFGRNVALSGRLAWQSTEGANLPLPRSEQWGLGGATTVRGQAENLFFGERVAWGGLEWVLGPTGGGQGYLFYDQGWVRTTNDVAGVLQTVEQTPSGFGVGLRTPTAVGSIDLSLGFAGALNFDDGKLHVSLIQRF